MRECFKELTAKNFYDKITDYLLHFTCFLSLLLIGADVYGFDIGVNVRYDQFILVIFALLLYSKNKFRINFNYFAVGFVLFTLVSAFLAISKTRGLMFWISICYNVVFVFYAVSSYVRFYGLKRILDMFRLTLYLQVLLAVVQVCLYYKYGYFIPTLVNVYSERMCIWFYEPSYFATYLMFAFAFGLYMVLIAKKLKYFQDIVASAFGIILSTSATGIFGAVIAVGVVVLIWFIAYWRRDYFYKLLFVVLAVAAFIAFKKFFPDLYAWLVYRASKLIKETGSRYLIWPQTWALFKEYPLFGVGPGNYNVYFNQPSWYTPANVTLELLSTTGIFSTVLFYGISVYACVRAVGIDARANGNLKAEWKRSFSFDRSLAKHTFFGTEYKVKDERAKVLVGLSVGLFMFTVALQLNQTYLRLYHWLFFSMIYGGVQIYLKRDLNLFNRNMLFDKYHYLSFSPLEGRSAAKFPWERFVD